MGSGRSDSNSSSASCGLSTPPYTSSPPPSEDGFREPNLCNFEPVHSRPRKEMSSILNSIPPKPHCDILYRSFLEGVNPIIPLIHVPTFATQWNSFWSRFAEGNPNPSMSNPTFTPLLLAILFAGATSMHQSTIRAKFDGRSKEFITTHLLSTANAALAATSFPRSPTTCSMMAFLILNSCLVREEDPLASCSFIGTAMRVGRG